MEGLKFLIVDDSIIMRRIIKNSLKIVGFKEEKMVEAYDGEDALLKLDADTSINFIITAWNMPGISGFQFVKAIKKIPNFASIPILLITCRALKEDIAEALEVGVNDYLVKPFTPTILGEKIDAIIISFSKDTFKKGITQLLINT